MGLGCSLRLFQKGGASMAGWEQELAKLLRELGVTQEEPEITFTNEQTYA